MGFYFNVVLVVVVHVKGMIMGASASSVWYNVRVRHPTKEVPILDYDLALLFQPMLLLGITVGVSLSVVFPYWLITVLIIILFVGTSSRSFFKGIEMWKEETLLKVCLFFSFFPFLFHQVTFWCFGGGILKCFSLCSFFNRTNWRNSTMVPRLTPVENVRKALHFRFLFLFDLKDVHSHHILSAFLVDDSVQF